MKHGRALKYLSHLAWVTICLVLGKIEEINMFDDVCSEMSAYNNRSRSRGTVSRSRSPINNVKRIRSPQMTMQHNGTFNSAFSRSVL
jgi:hypothetical protein